MKKISRILIVFLLVITLILPGTIPAVSANEETSLPVERLAGKGRMETAVEVSKVAYKEGADAVVLAGYRGEVDALTGTLLANAKNAPVLLTEQKELSAVTKDEILRLKAKTVYILGGETVVSQKVMSDLDKIDGITVQRVYGSNRFETAHEVAKKAEGKATHVFLALGANEFLADALSVGPVSALKDRPVLLTTKTYIPAATRAALKDLGVTHITIVGGEVAINKEIAEELAKDYTVDRIAGTTREKTAELIADRYFDQPMQAILTNDGRTSYADALVGGYLGALMEAPILLTQKKSIAGTTTQYVQNQHIRKVFVLGGPTVVNKEVFTSIEKTISAIVPADPVDPEISDQFYQKEVIAPQYDQTRGFSEGLAAVEKNGKWGYIDQTGKVVIDFQYEVAHSFSEGKALVGKDDGEYDVKLGIIDQENRYTPLRYESDSPGESNMREYHKVGTREDYKYYEGYIQVQFDSPTPFYYDENGLYTSIHDHAELNQWGEGYYTPTEDTWAALLSDGMNFVDLQNGGWLFDNSGFSNIRPFNQGLAPVSYSDYKKEGRLLWTFIDKEGNEWNGPDFYDFYVRGIYNSYQAFNDYSLASLMDEHGKWGAANKQGEVVIPFEYDHLMTFTEGVAPFKRDGKYGFINEKNEAVIPAQYDYVSTFNKGVALVQDRKQFYLIDQKRQRIPGTLDIAAEHYFWTENDGHKMISSPDEYFITKENSKYGFKQISEK